jgi:hypothetical protein
MAGKINYGKQETPTNLCASCAQFEKASISNVASASSPLLPLAQRVAGRA